MNQLLEPANPAPLIEPRILEIRNQRVILDSDLAGLYRVTTKSINQAVSRNMDRFPDDFSFLLTLQELSILRSQFVTSRFPWGGRRYMPRAFTEQGVAMLSSVLRSEQAILVNIAIMRTFVKLRSIAGLHSEALRQLDKLEKNVGAHDEQIRSIFDALRLLVSNPPPARRIGF